MYELWSCDWFTATGTAARILEKLQSASEANEKVLTCLLLGAVRSLSAIVSP